MRSCARKAVMHSGHTMTQLHFQDRQNVNSIIARYKKTGVLGTGQSCSARPQFGNFIGMDFVTMNNIVAQGMQSFAQLPSVIRRRFNNDAGVMLEWLQNEGNKEEAIKLGLIPKPPKTAPEGASQGAQAPAAP